MKVTGNGGPGRIELTRDGGFIVVLKSYRYGFELGGVVYHVKRKGFFAPNYRLLCDQTLLLTADQGPFGGQYAIAHAGEKWIFKPVSFGALSFALERGAARAGLVMPGGGWFSFYKNIVIELPDEMSAPAQVFLVWLALRRWQDD
jgi:hypothetical protein